MTPRKPWLLIAALPLVLLAGCELRAGVGVDVDADGAGQLSYTLATDAGLRAAARRAGADPLATLADAVAQLPGWRVERAGADGVARVTLATTFDDPGELALVSGQVADALAAPELRPLDALRVDVDDRTVELRGRAALDVASAVEDLGVGTRRARRVLADHVVLRVVARMPGEVLESNADERVDDTVVAWRIDAGQQRELRVLSRRPWTVARLWRLLVTTEGMVALAIGLVMIFAWRGRPAGTL